MSRLCYLFAHLHLLSSGSFSSVIFIFLLFSSLTLPTSAFQSVHIVGSLASELPSIIVSVYTLLYRIIFPTSLCGVLVFDSVSRSSSSSSSSSSLSTASLSHTIFHTQLCHTPLCHTHTTLSHIIFHTQLCHTQSFMHNFVTHNFVTHNFVTHHLSHTTLSHTTVSHTSLSHIIFHTQLCHTQLRLSHTTLSHTNFITHSSTQTFSHTPSFNTNFLTQCVAGVALGDIDVPFAWQAWHLATSTAWQAWRLWHWAGSGGALGTPRHFAWQAWRLCSHPPLFCVAGVALGEMYLRLAWQVWHLWHWAGSGGVLGRRVSHSPGAPRHFAWRAWHSAALTPHLRGSRGTW